MATTVFYPDANPESVSFDGLVTNGIANQTWADLHDAATGTGVTDSSSTLQAKVEASSSPNTNKWTAISRSVLLFDTSSLTGLTPTAAALRIYVASLTNGLSPSLSLDVVDATPASNTGIVDADYDQFGTTLLGTIDISSLTGMGYDTITLNASGLAAIQTSGITKLGLRISADRTNTEPTWASDQITNVTIFSSEATSGLQPYLEVTHSVPFKAALAVQRSRILGGN